MKYLIWLLVFGLIVAHQDLWYWEDDTLVFGFMPIGLFYHACLSLAAGLTWWLACIFAWPKSLQEIEPADESASGQEGAA